MDPIADNVERPWPSSTRSLVGMPTPSLREELASANVGSSHNLSGIRSRVENGSGFWDFLQISRHIVVSITDATYERDHWVDVPGSNQFKIRIVLNGKLLDLNGKPLLSAGGAYLATYPGSVGNGYIVVANERLRMVVLHCDGQLLTDDLGLPTSAIPAPLATLVHQRATGPDGVTIRLRSELLRAANDMVNAIGDFPGPLRRPFLEARAHEIICYALKQLSTPLLIGPESLRLSTRDLNRVHEARDILADSYANPPSLAQLARSVGLSQTKLKTNFKAVFGVTAFEFVRRRRMEMASELLLAGDITVAEVAYQVGFEYPANFTHAYQRYFGMAPSNTKLRRLGPDKSSDAAETS